MSGTTNFLVFNPTKANQETDTAYAVDATRTGGAGVDALWPSDSANKTLYQATTMTSALGQMLANKNFSVSDADYAALVVQLANILTTADLVRGVQSLSWSPSITLNATVFSGFAIPLQGATSLSLTGVVAGQLYVLLYTQDSVGGHVVTFGAGFDSGPVPQPAPTASALSAQIFFANSGALLTPIGPVMSAGGVNSTPIGNSAPSTGAFTTLTARTPAALDNSANVATTAWALLGFAVSLAVNGYIQFPSWLGGIIMQWGIAYQAGGSSNVVSTPVNFNTSAPFSAHVFFVGITPPQQDFGSISSKISTMCNLSSLTGFTAYFDHNDYNLTNGFNFPWFAIGY